MAGVPRNRYLVYATLALTGLAVDLATKAWMFGRLGMPGEGGLITLWPEVLTLETHLNEGALFGMGQGRVVVFAGLGLLATLFIPTWLFAFRAACDPWLNAALGVVTGGILGNLFDRVGLPGLTWNYPPERIGQPVHAVRDWIHFQIPGLLDWPVFNVADSLLVCGAAMLIWQALVQGTPEPAPAPQPAEAPAPPRSA